MNEQSTLIHHQEVALMAKKTGAANNRGNSKQDYATPGDFRAAVVRRYDFPSLDLAASDQNRFGKFCITEETDS